MIQSYPNHNVPFRQKGKKWIRDYAKAMWWEWQQSTFYNQQESMVECQDYAKGQQSTTKYKKALDQEANQGYLNLDWSPISILPKYVDIVVGKIVRTGLTIEAKSIDQLGVDARQDFRHKLMAITELQKRLSDSEFFMQNYGMQMDAEDIEVFMEMGYKDSFEAVAEDAIKLTDEMVDEQEIYRGVIKNLVVEGIGGVREYEDNNGVVKYRKINPINFIHSSTQHPDFRDAYHFGELLHLTISELKAMDVDGVIGEKEWQELAEKGMGKFGNPDYRNAKGMWFPDEVQYDGFRIECLDFECKTVKAITHSKKKGKFQDIVKKRQDDYEAPEGTEVMRKNVTTWMRGFWIVGTDHVLDWGEVTNIYRGNKSQGKLHEAYSNFIVYAPSFEDGHTVVTSMTRRAIPFVDGAQLAWLNFQNVIARAVPKGGYVDAKSMAKAAELLKLSNPLEILKLFKAKGWMVGHSSGIPGDNSKPIIEMENGLGRDFQNYLSSMEFNINQVREVTGINQVVDASTPSSGTLVGTAKLAEAATNNSLVPLLMGKKSIRERAASCVVKKIQSIVTARAKANMPLPAVYKGLGEIGLQTLQTATEFAMAEFAIRVKNEQSEEERMAFYQELERAVQNQEITTSQSLQAKRLAVESVDKAIAYLRKEIKKNKAEAQQKAQQDMMMNQQIQEASAQAKTQQELAKIEAEKQKEIEILNVKYQWEMQLEQMRSGVKMQVAGIQAESEINKETIRKSFDHETKITAENIKAEAAKEKSKVPA